MCVCVCVCVRVCVRVCVCVCILRVSVLIFVPCEIKLLTDFHKITFEDAIKHHTTLVFLTW